VNAKLYVETLLLELVQDCRSVLPSGFIFQQDGAPAHTAKLTQDWIAIAVNPLVKMNGLRTRLISTLWTTMSGELGLCLNATSHFNPAGKHRWAQESSAVDMGPAAIRLDQQSHIELPEKTSGLCESWWSTLLTHANMNYLWDFGICNNSQCFLTMKITSWWLFHVELKIWHRIFTQP